MKIRLAAGSVAFVILFSVSQLFGQLPNSRLHRIFPFSGKAGSTIDVTLAGADLDEATEIQFSNPKITGKVKLSPATEIVSAAPIPNQFTVTIPADVEPGIYEVRANGRFGLSTPRRFVVSSMEEAACNDQNRTADSSMALTMNSAVNAKAIANAHHYYKFTLKKDEKVSIVCQTKVLDSKMDPVLVITDLNGKEIARGRSSTIQNASILFKAPIASQYILQVRDAVFAGGADFFYRISLSNRPYIAAVDPVVIQKNSTTSLKLLGWNLPNGAEVDGIETLVKPIGEVVGPAKYSEEMPIQTSSAHIDWQTVALKQNGKLISNQIPIFVTNEPVTVEDAAKDVNPVKVPTDIAGRFSPNNEEDLYEFSAKTGEVYYIDVFSHRLGKPTDVILTVKQQVKAGDGAVSWKNISVVDDPGNRAGGIGPNFSTSTDDPGLRFQVPADGVYRVLVKDQFGTYDYDARSNYRLSIRKPNPDFRVVCNPVYGRPANGNQILASALTLRRGGRAVVSFNIEKLDGFAGPVVVSCEGLPAGVECPPVQLAANQSSADLVFYAKDDAQTGKAIIKISGKSKIGDREVVRSAFYSCVTWDTANKGQVPAYYRRASDLELSVMPHESAAVTVQVGDGKVLETSLGGKISLPVKLTRRHSYVEPLKLTARSLPGQLKPGDLTIAKDKSDGAIEIFVKDKNTPLGTYAFSFKGDAKFKYSRNPEAVAREEAEHKRLEDLLKATMAEKTKLASDMANMTKAMPELDKAITAAKAKLAAAKKEMDAATQKIKTLEAAIQKTKSTKPPVDPVVIQAAEAELNDLKEGNAGQTKLSAADAAVKLAEKAKSDAAAKINDGKQKTVAIDAKTKQIEAARNAAKTRAENLKKLSAPKDLFYVAVSNPLQIKVVASPIVIENIPEQANTVETKVTPVIKISRKYGFADAVNLAFKAPAGVAVKPAAIAKDKTEIPVAFDIQKNCPVGTHAIEVTATAKFNNVDVKTVTTFNLKVSAK